MSTTNRLLILNEPGFVQQVKNAGRSHDINDCGASLECPKCRYQIFNSDVSSGWPGLPTGVKFEPSDSELLIHLAAKCGMGSSEPQGIVDEFIPTVGGGEGICYTHPENLPGARKDGSSFHVFYRISNAYAKGNRKHRLIKNQENSSVQANVRWHLTGKTKAVIENGIHKGFKKIFILTSTVKGRAKSVKLNWIMHQYHLGTNKDEKDGELVVSKLFYQPPHNESTENEVDNVIPSASQNAENLNEPSHEENEEDYTSYLASESQDQYSSGTNFLCWNDFPDPHSTAYGFETGHPPFTQDGSQTGAPSFQYPQFPFPDISFDWENQR